MTYYYYTFRYYAQASLKLPGCTEGCNKTMVERANFTVLRHLDLNSDKAFAVRNIFYFLYTYTIFRPSYYVSDGDGCTI